MKCDLCNLKRRTHWYYEDEYFVVCDCIKCNVKMIVLKRHDIELTPDESKRLINLLTKFAERKRVSFVRRSIHDHWHMHIRTARRRE